jgi:hypothetical protein
MPVIRRNSLVRQIRPNRRAVRVLFATAPIAGIRILLQHTLGAVPYNDRVAFHRLARRVELQARKYVQRPLQFGQRAIRVKLIQLNAHNRLASRFASRAHCQIHVWILSLQHRILPPEPSPQAAGGVAYNAILLGYHARILAVRPSEVQPAPARVLWGRRFRLPTCRLPFDSAFLSAHHPRFCVLSALICGQFAFPQSLTSSSPARHNP